MAAAKPKSAFTQALESDSKMVEIKAGSLAAIEEEYKQLDTDVKKYVQRMGTVVVPKETALKLVKKNASTQGQPKS